MATKKRGTLSSFAKSYNQARQAGDQEFTYNGKQFSTRQKGESATNYKNPNLPTFNENNGYRAYPGEYWYNNVYEQNPYDNQYTEALQNIGGKQPESKTLLAGTDIRGINRFRNPKYNSNNFNQPYFYKDLASQYENFNYSGEPSFSHTQNSGPLTLKDINNSFTKNQLNVEVPFPTNKVGPLSDYEMSSRLNQDVTQLTEADRMRNQVELEKYIKRHNEVNHGGPRMDDMLDFMKTDFVPKQKMGGKVGYQTGNTVVNNQTPFQQYANKYAGRPSLTMGSDETAAADTSALIDPRFGHLNLGFGGADSNRVQQANDLKNAYGQTYGKTNVSYMTDPEELQSKRIVKKTGGPIARLKNKK